MGNKLSELACLNLAIEQCMKQRGVSKKIGHLLSGNDVVRDDDERPDFLRLTSINGQQHETLIGIEHFRVDHYSEKKSRQKFRRWMRYLEPIPLTLLQRQLMR